MDLDFDVIVLSDIWNYNLECYSNIFLKNYTSMLFQIDQILEVWVFLLEMSSPAS